jgi:hypothetical protein
MASTIKIIAALALLTSVAGCHRATAAVDPAGDFGTDDTDTDDTGDTDDTDTGPPFEGCDELPSGPFNVESVPFAVASEDIAFDDVGDLVGSDNTAIFKTPIDGPAAIFVAGLDFRAGMRYLPDGQLMINHDSDGTLRRIDTEGQQHVVLTGLSYPNGMTVDPLGYVYVTEHDAGRVLRVDPYANTSETLVSNLTNANGVTFNYDYTVLYIDTFNDADNNVHMMEIDIETGEHGPLETFASNIGSGWNDGMGVDACGNLYVCDYECFGDWDDTCIYRITPDGDVGLDPIIDPPAHIYLPNFDWGSGLGGWDPETIYIPHGWDHNVYQVDLGVPSKPRVYPPY